MIFYTYMWLRENGSPYYVGKGTRARAHHWHDRIGSAPPKNRILLEPHTSEADAFEAEIFLIGYYGRKDQGTGVLSNLTDGGDAPPVRRTPHTTETRDKIRRSLMGHGCSAETRALIGASSKARIHLPNKGATGYKQSPESRAKRRITIARMKVEK